MTYSLKECLQEARKAGPRIRLAILHTQKGFDCTVTLNTSDGVVEYHGATRLFEARPDHAEKPYVYSVEFEALNFVFKENADSTVVWEDPSDRPSFIVEPFQEKDDRMIVFPVIDATIDRQHSKFSLRGEKKGDESGSGKNLKFDPTIVNNPDRGPDFESYC